MAVAATTSSQSTINEYKLEGGLTVRDKTHGIACVRFSEEQTRRQQCAAYEIFINGKKIIFPTCSEPSASRVFFNGSLKITLKVKDDGLVKISEVDATGKTAYYVNTKSCVNGIAYDTYSYIPKELNLEEASLKITNLPSTFKPDQAIYNRHGVAMFGWEDNRYALYWASPHEPQVKKMEADCTRYRDGGTSFAKSNDGAVNFQYLLGGNSFLNAELATRIPLNTS